MSSKRPAWLREIVNEKDIDPKAQVEEVGLEIALSPRSSHKHTARRPSGSSKARSSDPSRLPPYDKDLECRHCGKKFRRVCNYREHQRVHSNEYKFQCSVHGCNRKFMWRSSIQAHLRSHQAKMDRHRRMPSTQTKQLSSSHLLPKGATSPLDPVTAMSSDIAYIKPFATAHTSHAHIK